MKRILSLALNNFAERAQRTTEPAQLCRRFEVFLEPLGFSGFFYTAIPGIPRKEPQEGMFLQSVLLYASDRTAVESLMKSEFFGKGPILIRMVAGPAEPFTPYQAFKEVTGKPPPGRPEEVLEDPSVAYSLLCPLDTPDRRCGITLLSKERSILKLYRQLWRVKWTAYSGAVLFHERWKALVHKQDKTGLSFREVECLLWAAQGKTAWEISTILSISERTVRFHLDNAGKKLDAVNTTQTVALAIAQGLIPPRPFE